MKVFLLLTPKMGENTQQCKGITQLVNEASYGIAIGINRTTSTIACIVPQRRDDEDDIDDVLREVTD